MSKRNHLIQRGVAVLFTLCIALGSQAFSQTYTEGSIAGTVFDASGAVVANAAIVIHNDGTNAQIELTSDGSGFFMDGLDYIGVEPGWVYGLDPFRTQPWQVAGSHPRLRRLTAAF